MNRYYGKRIMAVVLLLALLSTACGSATGKTEPLTTSSGMETTKSSIKTETTTAAASTVANPVESTAEKLNTITVTDAGGKQVTLPQNVKSIVVCCYGGVTHELAALGVQDKIVAQPDMKKFPVLASMYPEFNGLPFVGSFDDVNVEEILKLKPDVVINSVTSNKGNGALENAGITVLQALTGKGNVEKVKTEFSTMGKAFGNPEQAEKLIGYWKEKIDILQKIESEITKKKKVYYMLGAETHTNGPGWWGDDFIQTAGGINAAADLKDGRDTSIEQVVKWNPDVIILSENEGKYMAVNDILGDSQLQNINAIKNKQVYEVPIGTFWWDRPSPESVLGFMWLAKTLYPEETKNIDLKKETSDFYKTFFNHDLSDAEYEAFLNPVR